MKLLFSEVKSDYSNYIFPYAIWAVPEDGETPSMIFSKGFLPASLELDRFYMCRQIRIKLDEFERSSENRRILRKCEGIDFNLVPRSEFYFTHERREFCKNYADIKFGKDVMTYERLDRLLDSKIISHLLVFKDSEIDKEVGIVTFYVERKTLIYYYYAFYDLNYYDRNLGMYMMTAAVDWFAQQEYGHIYLGSCYSLNALYKTQFSGAEFFNGFHWSKSLEELKYQIQRDSKPVNKHLLETEEYRDKFYEDSIGKIAQLSDFALMLE